MTLRAIERSDLPTFVRWFNDPDVIQHLTLHLPMSLAEEERWFDQQLTDKSKHIFAIETEDGVHNHPAIRFPGTQSASCFARGAR